jgi:hypothetical protein
LGPERQLITGHNSASLWHGCWAEVVTTGDIRAMSCTTGDRHSRCRWQVEGLGDGDRHPDLLMRQSRSEALGTGRALSQNPPYSAKLISGKSKVSIPLCELGLND